MKRKFGISLASAIAMALLFIGIAVGMSMGGVDGVWEFVEDGGNGSATCDTWVTGEGDTITDFSRFSPSVQTGPIDDENQIRYGLIPGDDYCPNSSSEVAQISGFGFKGVASLGTITPDVPILIGRGTHFNNPIQASNSLEWIDIDMTVSGIVCGGGVPPAGTNYRTYIYRVSFDETPNSYPCVYGDTNGPCDDKITIATISSQSQAIDCTSTSVPAEERGTYTLQILGWIPDVNQDGNCSDTPYNEANISTAFITPERMDSYACLFAKITDFQPTAVQLQSFNALWVGNQVEISWETITETNTLGFNIFRSTTRTGTQLKLNSELIYSNSMPGSLIGATYQFVDQQAVEGTEYFYWLQEVELDGSTESHGPAEFLN